MVDEGGIQAGQVTPQPTDRAVLEAKLNMAIKRAQRQYLETPAKIETKVAPALSHLGRKVDIRA